MTESDADPRVQMWVRRLIDRWNVGIREGELEHAGVDEWRIPKIQKILQNLGITVCLENVDTIRETRYYDIVKKESTTNLKFIMAEVTEKTVKYPF
jgi:hypothetical protein